VVTAGSEPGKGTRIILGLPRVVRSRSAGSGNGASGK